MKRLSYDLILNTLQDKLEERQFERSKATSIAEVFVENSLEGVYSHGINRFPRFISDVDQSRVDPAATPDIKSKFKAIQQWDGMKGPGITNAILATESAMRLSNHYGLGCVSMSNTNHWMRGGTYGRLAAANDCIFIGWTNTIANMPAWGADDNKLGNNPLVIAVPGDPPIVLDMAMSQFSYGKMEDLEMKEQHLPLPGGFDQEGILTTDPGVILSTGLPVPMGYWKGAGLSLVLDILAAILSNGLSTHEISKLEAETAISQVFICIDMSKTSHYEYIGKKIQAILNDYKSSIPKNDRSSIIYPGERTPLIKGENLKHGIPVLDTIWEKILNL
ncbi:3-dehydro-L-gulonate 2-dehydrogenase [Portibacter marinus]|uniref:3-dehydro-L-gulonate 2-dehydrogenase n=1 Tax=Portibacter marinus TaxID=2898660 RepID=UPI001F3510DD|nr:3-dehydro-L-gulonate 2-dehydrogenase [Portibacter marinus]